MLVSQVRMSFLQEGNQPRPRLLEQLGTMKIGEDDQYNADYNRRRLFWLDYASQAMVPVLDHTTATLRKFPQTYRGIYLKGRDFGELVALNYFPPSQRQLVRQYIEEAVTVAYSKGFRHNGNLLSAREHKAIGSTVYEGFWRLDPDIPVGLLNDRLILEKDSYTFEEADKGRRLSGHTKLDPATGRVTTELDPEATSNSYHFLPQGQVVQIQAREAALQEAIEQIVPIAILEQQSSLSLLEDLEKCMFGEMTTPQFNIGLAVASARLTEDRGFNVREAVREARRIAFDTGCWDFMLTPQEILLRGVDVNERYNLTPYTPLAIQDGAAPQDVAHLRRGENFMEVTTAVLGYERPLAFKLEELTYDLQTVKSPTFVYADNAASMETERFIKYTAGNIDFPFARPGEWYYKA
ncbi:hypothetical protein HYW42_01270 [Candidatus Daviesbacteria bacterium]|nr:hypothetical protein [Candidatus Daviesbacteria bacterium]